MSKLIARMFLSAMLCTVTFWGGNIRAEEFPTRKSTEQQPTRWEHYNQYARWSFGANIGLPFFAGNFQSNSYDKLYWGIMADLQGGYQFTPVIGLRANLGYAQGKTGAKDFEQDYWLPTAGEITARHRCPEACNTRTFTAKCGASTSHSMPTSISIT